MVHGVDGDLKDVLPSSSAQLNSDFCTICASNPELYVSCDHHSCKRTSDLMHVLPWRDMFACQCAYVCGHVLFQPLIIKTFFNGQHLQVWIARYLRFIVAS